MTDNLIIFLRARLNEDEQTARALLNACRMLYAEPDFFGTGGLCAAAHWRRFNEARIIADVDAKRKIIDECERTLAHEDHGHWLANQTLAMLALPYRDHPDYRTAWEPAP